MVVVSEKPFTVWIYSDYHLKFSRSDYQCNHHFEQSKHQTSDLPNKINSQKKDDYFDNMWIKTEYLNYLKDELKMPDQKIKDHDKQIDRIAKICVQSNIAKLKLLRNTAIVLGLDLMVDELFNVWLLKVDSLPSMENSSVNSLVSY